MRIGSALERLAEKWLDPVAGDAERETRLNALADRILRRVACRNLRRNPALRVAEAVLDGRLAARDLEALLGRLDQVRGELACPPSAWFVQSAKRLFGWRGIEW